MAVTRALVSASPCDTPRGVLGSPGRAWSWDFNYQIEDHFSWFVPNKKGEHNFKIGARFNYTEYRRVSENNRNGTFTLSTDLPFDPANPQTYPERLTIRTPGSYDATLRNRTFELYAQDKWQMGQSTTLSIGLRYDLEIIPRTRATIRCSVPARNTPSTATILHREWG